MKSLLPGIPPIFPRNRWVGSSEAIDYVGLLASIHMIFTALVPPGARELEDSSKPITEDDFVAHEEVNIDADMQARGLEDLQHIGDIVEAAAVVDENQFGRHLAEYNQKMQKGAVEFALLQPQGEVVLMRKCLAPALESFNG